jgi:hypothetical protein
VCSSDLVAAYFGPAVELAFELDAGFVLVVGVIHRQHHVGLGLESREAQQYHAGSNDVFHAVFSYSEGKFNLQSVKRTLNKCFFSL